ncbi:MAG: D-arabinono-1,4-lactone oxidase [Chloroflexota bacterium]
MLSVNNTFSNWAGNLQFAPKQVQQPTSLDEIIALVNETRRQNGRIRLVGSGHSWMPLISTDDVLVSLDGWQGLEAVDHEAGTATLRAGTKLAQAGRELFEQGVAMTNMGDIDVQSLAGAFFTGTHGTGVNFPILAANLVGVTLVTASGDVVEWNENDHPDEMNAVRVSFGAFGIVVKMTVSVIPAYKLQVQQYRLPIQDALANLELFKQSNRQFEFFWFPHADTVAVKRLNETDRPLKATPNLMSMIEEHALGYAFKWAVRSPKRGPMINRTIMKFVDAESEGYVAHAHQAFASTRDTRFNEMEYNIPAGNFDACFEAIVSQYHQPNFDIFFPIECRWVKQDNAWLSPAYERDSAYIAVHQLIGAPYKDQFAKLEAIFRRFGGRPHWGKLNTMTREDGMRAYPRMNDFIALRNELDPNNMFCNDYLVRMFA